jgi:acyl carrier protein
MDNREKNLKYIREVKPEEIKWTKLFGAYSCGKKIGEEIKKGNLLNLKVLKNIENEIEHQSTLWTLTPFVMIFLTRELEKEYGSKKEEFYYLLGIYKLIVETLKFIKENALGKDSFNNLEIYLNMEEFFDIGLDLEDFEDEEEYEEYIEAHFEEENLEKEFNSAFYYTNFIVENSKDIIKKFLTVEDGKIKNLAKEILEKL